MDKLLLIPPIVIIVRQLIVLDKCLTLLIIHNLIQMEQVIKMEALAILFQVKIIPIAVIQIVIYEIIYNSIKLLFKILDEELLT